MAQQSERLARLLTEELDDCCDVDIDARVETLEGYASNLPANLDGDVTALQTLGDGTRYRIVRLLAEADRALCVCEITPVVDVSDSAVSHALSDLRDAGLVTRRKDGQWRYYEPSDRALALIEALDSTEEAQ
ncbi:MAG: metalloregulator ArsR/SmtB family transcription factor [Halovenus sp.]